MSELEVLVRDAGNLVARHRNVLIQVRSGEMTEAILARIESAALLARASAGGNVAMLAVIEDGATLASNEVRKAQATVVRRMLRDPRTYFVTVVAGQTVANQAIQTVMRLLLLNVPRLRSVGTVDEAIAWVIERVEGTETAPLRAAIAEARAMLGHA
jgi:hypothetical protein